MRAFLGTRRLDNKTTMANNFNPHAFDYAFSVALFTAIKMFNRNLYESLMDERLNMCDDLYKMNEYLMQFLPAHMRRSSTRKGTAARTKARQTFLRGLAVANGKTTCLVNYARVSTKGQSDGTSLAVQEARNEIVIHSFIRGSINANVYHVLNVCESGSAFHSIPVKLNALLRSIPNNLVVFVMRVDRLSRNTAEVYALKESIFSGKLSIITTDATDHVEYMTGKSDYERKRNNRLMFSNLAAKVIEAERNSIQLSVRVLDAHKARTDGRRPKRVFGYILRPVEGHPNHWYLEKDHVEYALGLLIQQIHKARCSPELRIAAQVSANTYKRTATFGDVLEMTPLPNVILGETIATWLTENRVYYRLSNVYGNTQWTRNTVCNVMYCDMDANATSANEIVRNLIESGDNSMAVDNDLANAMGNMSVKRRTVVSKRGRDDDEEESPAPKRLQPNSGKTSKRGRDDDEAPAPKRVQPNSEKASKRGRDDDEEERNTRQKK
jgi:DNA invertase Pin-like site-specific DNA recombinase